MQFLSILYDVRVFVCLVYMDLLCVCVCVESVDIASSSPPSVLLSGWVVVRSVCVGEGVLLTQGHHSPLFTVS